MPNTNNVSRTPRKGFNKAGRIYVRAGFHLVQCTGEAHSNGHIDHCMRCLGVMWGYEVAPLPTNKDGKTFQTWWEERNPGQKFDDSEA